MKQSVYQACRQHNFAAAKNLLDAGADIDAVDEDGCSPLLSAVGDADKESVEFLIQEGANVNFAQRGSGVTPLMVAAALWETELLQKLLSAGADANLKSDDADSALSLAISAVQEEGQAELKSGDEAAETVRALLEAGALTDAAGEEEIPPLVLAAHASNPKICGMLVEAGADVNAAAQTGVTPLAVASYQGNGEICRLLIQAKADVEIADNDGNTPLMLAAETNQADIVNLLLASGARIDARNKEGVNALMVAASEEANDVCRVLIDAGANVNEPLHGNMTPLMGAAVGGNAVGCELLLDAGADMGARDEDGLAPIVYAAGSNKSAKPCKLLLQRGNIPAQDMVEALVIAARNANKEALEVLLEAGASPEAKDSEGYSAIEAAAEDDKGAIVRRLIKCNVGQKSLDEALRAAVAGENKGTACVQYLLKAGANPAAEDGDGKNALVLARELGQEAVAKILEKRLKAQK